MSFDEQPDPLSDYMEAFDKMKRRAENSERLAATAAEQLANLRARLAAVEAERNAALSRKQYWWDDVCAATKRAEHAEAREKAKDERIAKLTDALREVLRVCVRVDGLDMRDFSAVLSTPSPSQPVKVAEEKPDEQGMSACCAKGITPAGLCLECGYSAVSPSKGAVCSLCKQPMPPGEEMFKFHGYSGDCPPAEKPCEPITSVDGLCHTHPRGHCPPAEKLTGTGEKPWPTPCPKHHISTMGCSECGWTAPPSPGKGDPR